MTKKRSTFFFPAMLSICLGLITLGTGCNEENKSSTEVITTDTNSMTAPVTDPVTAPIDTMGMDTATTRPIVPGT